MGMTSWHLIAVALLVLGGTGTVSMLAYRAALGHVEIESLPRRVLARAMWWRDHVARLLGTSVTLAIVGLAALVSG
jgi:hypothetical protein